MQETLRNTQPSQKLIDILSPILLPEHLVKSRGVINRLDAMDGLTIEEKNMLFCVTVWAKDPKLKGKIPQTIGITSSMIESYLTIVSENQRLADRYTELTESTESPKKPQEQPFVPSPLMKEIQDMRNQGRSIQEIKHTLQLATSTVYTYNSALTRNNKMPRLNNNNHPKPATFELENYVTRTLRRYVSKDKNISNKQLAEMATRKLNRPVTVSMVRNAVQKASLYERVPKRKPRKTSKTWSPTKEEGDKTKERVRHALRTHSEQHSGEPVVLFDIAWDLRLTPNHTRRVYNLISKDEKVPPTKHKPHSSPIPLDTLSAIKTALIGMVRNHTEKNPNQPISINKLAAELRRSRALTSRLYKEIFNQSPDYTPGVFFD